MVLATLLKTKRFCAACATAVAMITERADGCGGTPTRPVLVPCHPQPIVKFARVEPGVHMREGVMLQRVRHGIEFVRARPDAGGRIGMKRI